MDRKKTVLLVFGSILFYFVLTWRLTVLMMMNTPPLEVLMPYDSAPPVDQVVNFIYSYDETFTIASWNLHIFG